MSPSRKTVDKFSKLFHKLSFSTKKISRKTRAIDSDFCLIIDILP